MGESISWAKYISLLGGECAPNKHKDQRHYGAAQAREEPLGVEQFREHLQNNRDQPLVGKVGDDPAEETYKGENCENSQSSSHSSRPW